MSQPNKFRFSFLKDDSTWYAIDGGAVVEQATPYYLRHAPDKWEDTEIKWERNRKYWGIGRIASKPYEFVEDGATIIRHINYTYGTEGPCILVTEILGDDVWTYSEYIASDVDVSNYGGSFDRATVNLLEAGLAALIKANETVPYEIPIDNDPDHIVALLDGLTLYNLFNFVTFANPLDAAAANGSYASPALAGWRYHLPAAKIYQEGDVGFGLPGQALAAKYMGVFGFALGATDRFDNYDLQASKDGEVQFVLSQALFYENHSSISGQVLLKIAVTVVDDESSAPVSETIIYTDPNGALNAGANRNIVVDVPATTSPWITMLAGQRAYLTVYMHFVGGTTGTGGTDLVWLGGGPYTINARFALPDSEAKGFRYFHAYQKLFTLIAGAGYNYESDLLSDVALDRNGNNDSRPWQHMLTPGDALRGLGTMLAPSKLVTTITQMFDDISRREMAGMGIDANGDLRIEKAGFFLDNTTEIADLGSVTNFQDSWALDYLIGQADVGYVDQSYDQLNGKYEVNTTHNYKYPFQRIKAKGEWVSPYRADAYGIESMRANLSNKPTADAKSDNQTFILGIDAPVSGVCPLYRPAAQLTATGIPDPSTAFNLEFTPKRNMNRQGELNASLNYFRAGETITFQTSEKNQDLVSDLGAGTVTESADIAVNDLPAPLFLPVLFKGTAAYSGNLISDMAANPYGYFAFTVEINGQDVPLKGFPMEISTKPATHGSFDFTLLCCPDVDLSTLIR